MISLFESGATIVIWKWELLHINNEFLMFYLIFNFVFCLIFNNTIKRYIKKAREIWKWKKKYNYIYLYLATYIISVNIPFINYNVYDIKKKLFDKHDFN